MYAIIVLFVLKTVIYYSKLLDFQNCESLECVHSELNNDFIDRL